jgi:hypothetical protein
MVYKRQWFTSDNGLQATMVYKRQWFTSDNGLQATKHVDITFMH